MKKIISLSVLCCLFTTSVLAQLNVSLVGQYQYTENLNDIWGYADTTTGVEYAIVGVRNGVSIVSLADPTNPVEVDFVPGDNSTWRDIKTWGQYAYVTTDQGDDGLTMIDLSYLPDSVVSSQWQPAIDVNGTAEQFNKAHNIWIDENGYGYISGADVGAGGVMVLDLNTPGSPSFQGLVDTRYSHDCFTRGDTLWTADIFAGEFSVYDITNKSTPVLLATFPTPSAFCHNVWISDDGTTLFTTDEVANAPVAAFDVSNLNAIQQLDEFRPIASLGTGVIPHNVHVWQDWVVTSYYTDGLIVIDGSRPDNMIEVGNFDTFLQNQTGFQGIWGAYPFLPSGMVLCSDIGSGLYVFQPNYVRACWLEGNITDAVSGNPINNALLSIQTTNIQANSDVFGTYKTGTATAGTYTVLVQAPNYVPQTVTVTLNNGQLTVEDIQLLPAAPFDLVGQVVDANTGQPIPDAQVVVNNLFNTNSTSADGNGDFSFTGLPTDTYTIKAGIWGYKSIEIVDTLLSTSSGVLTIPLEIGYEDGFAFDLGWTVTGNAQTGDWERGVPVKIVDPTIGQSTPEFDNPNDVGDQCYVTGNGGILVGDNDVDNGTTILTSPVFDVANYIDPYVQFDFWFYDEGLSGSGDDTMKVKLHDGSQTVTAMTITNSNSAWITRNIKISDFLTPTSTMQVSFEIADLPGSGHIVEGAIDQFQVIDTLSVSTTPIELLEANMTAYPNPFTNQLVISYDFEQWDGQQADLVIFNMLGQPVYKQIITQKADNLAINAPLASGVYFVQMRQQNRVSESLKIVKVE